LLPTIHVRAGSSLGNIVQAARLPTSSSCHVVQPSVGTSILLASSPTIFEVQ
jgi:hypothetical protein